MLVVTCMVTGVTGSNHGYHPVLVVTGVTGVSTGVTGVTGDLARFGDLVVQTEIPDTYVHMHGVFVFLNNLASFYV